MKTILIALLVVLPAVADAEPMALFSTEADAQRHCPDDEVVWFYMKPGVYYLKGSRRYGADTNGLYVCRREADQAHEHLAPNVK